MDLPFAPINETTAFRIIQEALTNAARHAGVNEISILVAVEPHSLNLSIIDQGGSLQIVSSPGEGTSIQVEFPLEPEE
jgi:signal transduction histidine kinase